MNSKFSPASPLKDATKSASKRVYFDLRQRIIDMTLLPGTRIIERDIAAQYDISRTPVHEAVQRLAEEGLIEVVQRVGTFVARIPLDLLEEAMLVRTALEVAVIGKATQQVKPEDIVRLKKILADQHACVEANDVKGFHRLDEMFHEALATIAGLPRVWQMILQTKTQVDRYRQLTLPLPGRMDGVVDQHQAVVDALENGSANDAAAAMHEHLDLVLPIAKMAKTLSPEYFVNHLHTVD
jgi:DNA-binding GntR family transcriptional regulator